MNQERELSGMRGMFVALIGYSFFFIVTVIVAEVVVRLFFPVSLTNLRISEELVYEYVPNSEKVFRHEAVDGGAEVPIVINSIGLRGAEIPPKEKTRVMVYGDSYIAAEVSPPEETFASQLEHMIQGPYDAPIEVINAGIIGYGPDQAGLRIEQDAAALKPDLVVLGVFAGNDYGDLLRNKLFRLGDSGQLQPNRFTIAPELRQAWGDALTSESMGHRLVVWELLKDAGGQIASYLDSVTPDSGTMDFMSRLKTAFWRISADLDGGVEQRAARHRESYAEKSLEAGHQAYQSYVVDGDNEVGRKYVDHSDFDISMQPQAASSRYKIELMEQLLGWIQANLHRRGVGLVLLIIPSPIDVVADYGLTVDRGRYPSYDPAAPTATLAAIAERLNIPYVDLYQAFSDSDARGLYFSYQDAHWNAAGQRLAAEVATAEVLRQLGGGRLPVSQVTR